MLRYEQCQAPIQALPDFSGAGGRFCAGYRCQRSGHRVIFEQAPTQAAPNDIAPLNAAVDTCSVPMLVFSQPVSPDALDPVNQVDTDQAAGFTIPTVLRTAGMLTLVSGVLSLLDIKV